MLGSCGNDDQIARLDILILACDCRFSGAGSECQSLIDCVFLGLVSGSSSCPADGRLVPRHQFRH
jgi:hypothetical protein